MHSSAICPDICIAGGGIIGLSLALELHRRGARVTVLDQGDPLSQASTAAAGMLAASDPENPSQLSSLSRFSISLYPDYLAYLRELSGLNVPFQTSKTLQALPHKSLATSNTLTAVELSRLLPQLVPGDYRFTLLEEHSLDPRELARALLAAVRSTTIDLRPHAPIRIVRSLNQPIEVHTLTSTLHPSFFVDCTGAWATTSSRLPHLRVTPRKGQMLAVSLPPSLPLHLVVRTPDIYVVPRIAGPTPIRAIIGATVEDAGFDTTVHPSDIASLRSQAAALLPPLAHAPELESWAGLRPATSDGLPILGSLPGQTNHLLATGHYRNGILLAPATAHVVAQLIYNETPSIALSAYAPDRNPLNASNTNVAQPFRYSPNEP
ncbi:MAG TPA: FAD-dependent oxidoreductase [Edaphobacter sp.]|jgi:glycine oxidase|nr:FAD-dependent oxidoreductase [Edaphobacter sp.]